MPLELLWALELVLVSVSLSAEKSQLVGEWGATMGHCSAQTTAPKSGSKMAQDGPKTGSKAGQDGPRSAKNGQDRLKTVQNLPKSAQGPKDSPRGAKGSAKASANTSR